MMGEQNIVTVGHYITSVHWIDGGGGGLGGLLVLGFLGVGPGLLFGGYCVREKEGEEEEEEEERPKLGTLFGVDDEEDEEDDEE
jgi:hypothetical protein